MSHVIGVDTGGTFTDTVIVADDGTRHTGKSETTPADPTRGVVESLRNGADGLGVSLEELLSGTDVLFHGTTLTTNTVLEGTGGDVGLVTTRGHADALAIGRTKTRTEGLTREEQQHYAAQSKPDPPVSRVREIDERIDYKGEAVVELDEAGAREAVEELAGEVDALAVSLLWSFENPDHERRVAEIAAEVAPDLPVSLSHEVTPKLGEYERTATTVVNAATAPVLEAYVTDLEGALEERGFDGPLYVMKSTGGAMPPEAVSTEAVATINSGPTGGVIGSEHLGDAIGVENLLCTDVGGTSFDVGLVIDGELQTRPTLSVRRQTLYQLSVDIESIGSGGGSIAWIDDGGALRVGPKSAGADPGPACYGLGGDEPTVTDADLLLGYLDPDYFLGGRRDLDVGAAREAMERGVAEALGTSVEEAAAGVFEIVNGAMADLLRQVTVERGRDPREFSLLAYGGAGPLHASFYGAELGVESIVVPLGDAASVFSAFGIATSDVNYVAEASNPDLEPFDPDAVTAAFEDLEAEVRSTLAQRGFEEDVSLAREVELRYKGQVHQVSTGVPTGRLEEADLEDTIDRWEATYESLYGAGSTYAPVPVELVAQRAIGSVETRDPKLGATAREGGDPRVESRDVYWPARSGRVPTDVYDGRRLASGDAFDGPAVVQLPDTTVTVRPGQRASIDDYRNVHITEGDR